MKKLLFTLIFFFFFATPTFASDKFSNSFFLTYQINPSGFANVSEEIIITNKTSDYLPSEQTFTYHYLNLGNVKVTDELGEFEPEIKKEDNATNVRVVFRTKHAGIGQQTKITLRYQVSDILSLNGEVWQILIPGIKNLDFYENFQLNLLLPTNFPEIQYVSIEPKIHWQWTKDEIKDKGVVLIFGETQYYTLQLDYSLKNSSLSPVLESITIPPETNYQKVILQSISETPEYAEEDTDGNWILWFKLMPSQTKKIRAKILAKLFFNPEKSPSISKKQIAVLTEPARYWDYQNFTPFSSKIGDVKTVKEIYDFTVNSLQYNLNRLNHASERFTASEALKNPVNSICTDFTNVFIALARKNGIPAREVDGYAQTSSLELQPLSLEKDVLHAWPEYYDAKKQSWIMVDPTWEKTTGGIDYFHKLDLNHITFVKKGVSSEAPFPPGSYKTDDLHVKDVNVDFAKSQEWDAEELKQKNNRKIDLIYEVAEHYISGINQKGKVIIQNKSGEVVENLPVTFKLGEKTFSRDINRLIPFQTYEFEFSMPKTNFWDKKIVVLKTLINNKSLVKNLNFTPIYFWKDNVYYFAAGAGAVILSIIIIIYSVLHSLKSRKTKLAR